MALLVILSGCFQSDSQVEAPEISPLVSPVVESTIPGTSTPGTSTPGTTSEITSPPSVQVTFDGCGKTEKYAQEVWYENFKTAAAAILPQSPEACYSKNGFMVVLMVPGGYCEGSTLYKYSIGTAALQKATVDSKERGCLASPQQFGRRDGNVIKLVGTEGDAGCGSQMYFDYDFINNKITLIKELRQCEGDKEGKWQYY